jgi:hypothetical protein
LTGPENANHQCQICKKLFSKLWNYKAHQLTHDVNREKPHLCESEGCGKRFVRKTDLLRHRQCVHAKEKNYQCDLCGNRFARKDTLRRHEDDGCTKRFNIPSKTLKLQTTASWDNLPRDVGVIESGSLQRAGTPMFASMLHPPPTSAPEEQLPPLGELSRLKSEYSSPVPSQFQW